MVRTARFAGSRAAGAAGTAAAAGILVELVEVVQVNLAVAGLVLQVGPGPGRPGKRRLAEDIGQGAEGLLVIRGGIEFQHAVGERAVFSADIGLIFSQFRRTGEHRAFVGIRADEHVHVVVVARLVHLILVVREDVTIDSRPEAANADGGLVPYPLLPGHLAEFRQGGSADALHELQAELFRALDVADTVVVHADRIDRAEGAAALGNRATEEALGERRGAKHRHGDGTGALAHDGHLGGIAAESRDILLDPLETFDHVQKAVVAGNPPLVLGGKFRQGQEAQGAGPVFKTDKHDALLGELAAVLAGVAGDEAAAVDPNQHGELFLGRFGRGLDVQEQAVLGHLRGRGAGPGADLLRGHAARLGGLEHAAPLLLGHGGLPAEFAYGSFGIRDGPESAEPLFHLALNLALLHLDQGQRLGGISLGSAAIGQSPLDVLDQGLGREGRACHGVQFHGFRLFQRLADEFVEQAGLTDHLHITRPFPVLKGFDLGHDAFHDGDFHRRRAVETDYVLTEVGRVDPQRVLVLHLGAAAGMAHKADGEEHRSNTCKKDCLSHCYIV